MQVGCKDLVVPLNPLMRYFAFILSLYITALSLVPCTDGMPQNFNQSDIEITTTEHDHNHSDLQDDCTPFCTCACCGMIMTVPSESDGDASFPISNHTAIRSLYTFDYFFDFKEGIWHPPTFS